MSKVMKRALGIWIESKIGCPVVAGWQAKATTPPTYPFAILVDLGYSNEPLGCGKRDHVTRNAVTDFVETSGRFFRATADYRLQVYAIGTSSSSGRAVADAKLDLLEAAIMDLQAQRTPITMTDSEASPAVTLSLEAISMTGRSTPPDDTSGVPVVYSSAQTIRMIRLLRSAQNVEGVIQQIHMNEEEPDD
jgi:hypothetical protein